MARNKIIAIAETDFASYGGSVQRAKIATCTHALRQAREVYDLNEIEFEVDFEEIQADRYALDQEAVTGIRCVVRLLVINS